MAVPTFLGSSYRYLNTAAVTDVQTIIDDLIAELVTNGDWSTVSGGTGISPSTIKSASRADGAYIQVTMTRNSATRIQYQCYDHNGLLINNGTSTQQDVDAGGTDVQYFTGTFHLGVNTARATPEYFHCGILDRTPSTLGIPRASYYASPGPRNNSGTLTANGVANMYLLVPGATSYSAATTAECSRDTVSTHVWTSVSGAYLTYPYEFVSSNYSMGREFQSIMVPSSLSFGTELTVQIDAGTTAVFKVVGLVTSKSARVAARKS